MRMPRRLWYRFVPKNSSMRSPRCTGFDWSKSFSSRFTRVSMPIRLTSLFVTQRGGGRSTPSAGSASNSFSSCASDIKVYCGHKSSSLSNSAADLAAPDKPTINSAAYEISLFKSLRILKIFTSCDQRLKPGGSPFQRGM